MNTLQWIVVCVLFLPLLLILSDRFWSRFENKQVKIITVKKPKPHVLGIIEISEKSK